MKRGIVFFTVAGVLMLSSCAKKETATSETPGADAAATAPAASGPHAVVHMKDGSRVPGMVVASSATEMVVEGDDNVERKIPLTDIKSVEYGERRAARVLKPLAPLAPQAPGDATPPPSAVTTKTYELSVGTEVSVRTNETIDSGAAAEGQTFDAQVTRDVRDADGGVVIPRGADARIVIKSASKGGRFRGSSDLVLDMQSVSIGGRLHTIDTAEISQKGKPGVGANKRTAVYTGGGSALGAVIGAIAGGGKGAAIGAGAGAGGGLLTQVLTKGGAIKVPAESVLTFQLDQPLRVRAAN